MPVVRTTIRPWEEITVTDREYANLVRQDLIDGYYGTLSVTFYMYEGGPQAAVSGVTITITKGMVTLVGPTAVGVTEGDTGVWYYEWSQDDRDGAGDYLIHWEATDATDATVTAEETITLEAS